MIITTSLGSFQHLTYISKYLLITFIPQNEMYNIDTNYTYFWGQEIRTNFRDLHFIMFDLSSKMSQIHA